MDVISLDGVKSLHTAAIDARNGYREALADAEGKGMTPLFNEMIALHSKNADELAAVLRKAGETADDAGSFMSTVHRTIMSVRSLFHGLGKSVLPGLIDGEDRNLMHYTDVLDGPDTSAALRPVLLDGPDTSAALRPVLLAQRGRIEAAIVKMRAAEA